ncbi:TonB-dependent receptor domain-containing protein [Fluviibacter phosphoraccumulans]|jgi:vitamin B12 transporter|uniref:TonB-dependent receptor domain-containing protein n=1 Tax=Fluviibacter phosphoraccumulans TaxID=1751046 RepID=UPI0024E1F994|nr:TonB-dependent receptor [Fluviibacter phosphoraccumulans]
MSSYPVFTRSAVAIAIASLTLSAVAQESTAPTSPEQIAGPADPIVVTATRIPTRYNKLISDVTVVDQEQIRDYSPAEPISDVLANTPGVTVRSNGGLGSATNVQIRGGTNAQTILLIDGLRLNSATTGAPPWAYIPMPQIGRMEVVRGPTSSSYGSDAIGGVVQLFTRKGEGPTKFYADAGYGTYNTTSQNVGVEGSQDGFSYSVYGSNTHSVSFPTKISNASDYNPNPASYTNTSASGNFAYTVYPGQEIGVKALWGNGQNGFTNSKTQMATSLESLNVLSAYTKNRIVEDWTSLIRFGSSQDNSRSWYANNSQTVFNTTQKQAQWQNDLKLPVGNAMLAYEFLNQAVNSTTAYNVTSRNINTVQGGWNADIGNHLLQANLRNDDNSQFGNATTTSLGYGYFILPTVRGTASWGTGFQAPTFNQLYYPGSGGLYKGNANLQPTRSENTEAGLRYNDGVHSAGVIYYYNNITNLVNYTNNYATYTNVGRSIIQGVTTSYDGRVLGLNVMGSVDYQNPQNADAGTWLAYHPQGFGSLTIEKAVTDWKLGAQMQVQGPQQTAPGTSYNTTLGGYSLFNLYGNVKLYKDVSLFARLNNIFDKQYQTIQNYTTPGSNVFVGLRFDNR